MPNWAKIFEIVWLHSSVFALEKQLEKLNFQSFFTSNKPFPGYFQWNALTYFQKICSWTRYGKTKLIKNNSNIWVAFLRFCFTIITWKTKFSEFFLPLRNPLGASFNETRAPTSRRARAEQGIVMQNWSKIFQVFWSRSSVWSLQKKTWKAKVSEFFNL